MITRGEWGARVIFAGQHQELPGYKIVINAHPAICDMMQREKKAHVEEAQVRFTRQIVLVPRREYHLEQFDLTSA